MATVDSGSSDAIQAENASRGLQNTRSYDRLFLFVAQLIAELQQDHSFN